MSSDHASGPLDHPDTGAHDRRCQQGHVDPGREEARFRSLVQNISDIITLLGADGTIKYESPSVERILGFKPEELVGHNAFEFVHPEDIPALQGKFVEIINEPSLPVSHAFRFRHIDGSWVYLEAIGNNLLSDPGINGLVVTSRDVTARRALEEELHQAQKMEAIGQLAGGIAHDFNNMLMIIRGHSELMLDQEQPPQALRIHAEKILKTTDKASRLTQRLLAFSRKQVIAPRPLILDTAVKDCAEMLRQSLGPDIEISIVSPRKSWRARVDPTQLDQLLLNLAVNARDAMPNGGKLTLECSNIEVDSAFAHSQSLIAPGRYVMLAVSDTGLGMDAHTQAHIFEPFFTTKEKGKGTGLGLAIVYGIVRQSRGQILVSSELGQGTTFKIYFPAVEEAAIPAQPIDVAEDSQNGTGTVLLAEDEEEIRTIVQAFLEGKGYTVLAARDGFEAVQIAEQYVGPIDLLLTDVMMPRMRGPQLAVRLAPHRPDMKIIFMSGFAKTPELVEMSLDSETPLLRKPFALSELASLLREMLVLTHA
jgi:two-component system, cell cycle sensor histidine kinase and response regulator CckA